MVRRVANSSLHTGWSYKTSRLQNVLKQKEGRNHTLVLESYIKKNDKTML